MKEIIITCKCGKTRKWTSEQQERYAANGWPEPKRCKECAAKKRAAQQN